MDDFDSHLEGQLDTEEGVRFRIYDDATGLPFKRGDTLKGNLTVGAGINLMVPFDAAELKMIEAHRIDRMRASLALYPWYKDQDEVRQVALADLTYNLGLGGLLNWPHFLSYIAVKDYQNAVLEIRKDRVWINQVHSARADRIEKMILTGAWPADVAVASQGSAPSGS